MHLKNKECFPLMLQDNYHFTAFIMKKTVIITKKIWREAIIYPLGMILGWLSQKKYF